MAVCSSKVIHASSKEIFDILATPTRHSEIDGSNTVKGNISGPERLYLSAKFGMKMKYVIPYRITNTVVEYDENRLIAWRHFGGHIWRYKLVDVTDNGNLPATEVTECFDYSMARSVKLIQLIDAPIRNLNSIEKTLDRLEKLFS